MLEQTFFDTRRNRSRRKTGVGQQFSTTEPSRDDPHEELSKGRRQAQLRLFTVSLSRLVGAYRVTASREGMPLLRRPIATMSSVAPIVLGMVRSQFTTLVGQSERASDRFLSKQFVRTSTSSVSKLHGPVRVEQSVEVVELRTLSVTRARR